MMIAKWLTSCGRAQRVLRLLVQDALGEQERERFLAHAAQCGDCRDAVRAAIRADRLLWAHAEPPAGDVLPTEQCPDGETLASLAEGSAERATRRRWGPHVAKCAACLTGIRQLRAVLGLEAETAGLEGLAAAVERLPVSNSRRALAWQPALALGAAAAVLVVVLLWGHQAPQPPAGTPPDGPVVAHQPRPAETGPRVAVRPVPSPLPPFPGRSVASHHGMRVARGAVAPRSRRAATPSPAPPELNRLPSSALAAFEAHRGLSALAEVNALPEDASLARPAVSPEQWTELLRDLRDPGMSVNALPTTDRRLLQTGESVELLSDVTPLPRAPVLANPKQKQLLSISGR